MAKLAIEQVPHGLYPKLRQLTSEFNCKIVNEIWQSKYNDYVGYDCEPSCTIGFDLSVDLEGSDFTRLKFVEYLFNRFVNNVDKLESLLEKENICAT